MKTSFIKLFVALALCISMVFALASCDILPDELKGMIDGIFGGETEDKDDDTTVDSDGDDDGIDGDGDNAPDEPEVCTHEKTHWVTVREATCKTGGFKRLLCDDCKEYIENLDTPKSDVHGEYVFGECRVCGAEQPFSTGFTFETQADGTVLIKSIGECADTSLMLPEQSPDGATVSGIASGAFKNNKDITGIIVPESYTVIGPTAFYGCTSLSKVYIPDSVTIIGAEAFNSCPITQATVPASLSASISNDEISNVTLTGTGAIPNGAFNARKKLSVAKIEEGVSGIGDNAFAGTNVPQMVIPGSVKRIGESAFKDCDRLKIVELGEGVEVIAQFAFNQASFLVSINIPESVIMIEYRAFYQAPRLTSVTFADTEGWIYTQVASATTGRIILASELDTEAAGAKAVQAYRDGYMKKL